MISVRRTSAAIVMIGVLSMSTPHAVAQSLPPATVAALESASAIYVATQRASGERSDARPIWFIYDGGKIFFTTSPDSWKAKRIARGSPLYIWVGDEDGPFLTGTAEAVTDPALIDRMGEAYGKKYWIAWLGLFRPRSSRVTEGKTKAYLVTPSADALPAAPR